MQGILSTKNRVAISSRAERPAKAAARQKPASQRLIDLAVLEAEALAWQSGVPELLFITLAEEKVREVRNWAMRQEQFRRRASAISLV